MSKTKLMALLQAILNGLLADQMGQQGFNSLCGVVEQFTPCILLVVD